jgi:hypothetical protein
MLVKPLVQCLEKRLQISHIITEDWGRISLPFPCLGEEVPGRAAFHTICQLSPMEGDTPKMEERQHSVTAE